MGLWNGGGAQRMEFVRMKGPQGKGHSEMAVTKPKGMNKTLLSAQTRSFNCTSPSTGSGLDTPCSEPGFSATELWDAE